ncbi:dipicolinate synthase subunit A [Tissierella praeacuta DSM 18095]|uniref:Dipicolinate synthase subunit A n=1 Tax=Tissierella praeacuta DSM 18095 TaxID=1123404 RepID=A0A1M4V4G2_9FIRM|nr:dipicolinate synthase subunit DpsA [Tissierella praeacuta]TCU74072.1 dipicolinate synthase subunit A [Tissierella praeacuta]SHE63864.1 dipicolinate synthase subunit A [Tissierella praeacuta DSM 18095]SUP02891.1 Stage V sporulation protein FA [Tissierella praeacuta]
MRISVLGGDERSVKLANLLQEDGNHIDLFGFDNLKVDGLKISENLDLAIEKSNIVIGPLPCSKDNILLNTPLYSKEIKIEEIFNKMNSNQVFIGGKISNEISNIAKHYNIDTVDFLKREEMAVLNAIPTAEGAIQVAMEKMEITIHGSNIMILGFGRIGKILAKMLQGIGANVYIEARNYSDLAWVSTYGYNPIHLSEMKDYLQEMNVVFNTIPSMILNEEMLLKLNKECLVVDLASIPGGVDFKRAEELGINTVWALGLPGKVAPMTAARIMKDTIYNIIGELEE